MCKNLKPPVHRFEIGFKTLYNTIYLERTSGITVNNNQVITTIKERSSARAYSPEQLTQEELNTVLNAGLMAPTGMNKQEIHFTVVKGDNPVLSELDEEKRRLRGQEKQPHNFYYEAPVLIL